RWQAPIDPYLGTTRPGAGDQGQGALRLVLRHLDHPWVSQSELLVLVVDNRGVRPWEEEILISCVPPPDEVRRLPVLVANLEHLAVTIGLPRPMSADHDPISGFRVHCGSPFRQYDLPPWSSAGHPSARATSHRSVDSPLSLAPIIRPGVGTRRVRGWRRGVTDRWAIPSSTTGLLDLLCFCPWALIPTVQRRQLAGLFPPPFVLDCDHCQTIPTTSGGFFWDGDAGPAYSRARLRPPRVCQAATPIAVPTNPRAATTLWVPRSAVVSAPNAITAMGITPNHHHRSERSSAGDLMIMLVVDPVMYPVVRYGSPMRLARAACMPMAKAIGATPNAGARWVVETITAQT